MSNLVIKNRHGRLVNEELESQVVKAIFLVGSHSCVLEHTSHKAHSRTNLSQVNPTSVFRVNHLNDSIKD